MPNQITLDRSDIAFIFPGQGSQAPGMGADLYAGSKAAKRVFDEAGEILGFKLSKLCFEGPEEELRQTVNAQPAIMTASVAAMEALAEALGDRTRLKYVAGHSLGEYSALVAARAISFESALRLVRERGRLMQEAGQVREGAMAAVMGLDEASVELLCQQTGAEIANINSDGQIVISGPKQALIQAIDLSRAMGAKKAIPLVVSGAFHSSLMQPAVPGMVEALRDTHFVAPQVPVISNLTATPLRTADAIPPELVQQICRCIQWSRSVEYMSDHGVDTFVEVGPGRVLTGLVKRIAQEAQTVNVDSLAAVQAVAA
ncbi:MAG: ACP S-malonyltransferase [Chloroflexi bacterium]|nr:ACP S-malonyltransferase [Chloroflexota bacterium]